MTELRIRWNPGRRGGEISIVEQGQWQRATGGYAEALEPRLQTVERVEPFLSLHGLAPAREYLAEGL